MTEQTKPAWLLEREAQSTLDQPVLTDAKVQADVQVVLDDCLDTLAPAVAIDQSMREQAEKARNDASVLAKLGATITRRQDAVADHMAAGDIEKAVDERKGLDAAKAIRDDLMVQYQAECAATEGYDFDAQTRAIALLVSERENLKGLLASEAARAEVLATDAKHRQDARDFLTEQALLQLQIAEANSPARMAAIRVEQTRAATAAEHERRTEQAARTAPKPPSQNPEVAALAALRNRRPVGNPLGMGLKNQGW
jgi:hypothetical protein